MNQTLPTLETERLILRPCTKEDVEELHTMYWNTVSDEMARVRGKARRPNRQDIRDENEHFLSFANYSFLRPFGRLIVVLKTDGAAIGTCLLIPHVFTPEEVALCSDLDTGLTRFGTLEVIIRWALAKTHRGYGYGTEAAQVLLNYGLNTLQLQRILAETAPDNPVSIHVMEKIGMEIVSPAGAGQLIGMVER